MTAPSFAVGWQSSTNGRVTTRLRAKPLRSYGKALGVRPNLEGLSVETQAHVLLRVGMVTGWIGSEKQIAGAQEAAKDLITESLGTFEILGQRTRVGEARSDLARCYWREGAFNEARVMLEEALREFGETISKKKPLRW
ncbi:MAG: hypothetical protein DMF72_19435 [Acidobacteria bacterium]|nr:MAG: hypothetical protein DMF72_19435 [Acidobacteriota bacterium]